jgi:hypothetical protein
MPLGPLVSSPGNDDRERSRTCSTVASVSLAVDETTVVMTAIVYVVVTVAVCVVHAIGAYASAFAKRIGEGDGERFIAWRDRRRSHARGNGSAIRPQ